MSFSISNVDIRKKVAREAAALLYFGIEKEYKQAKLRAVKTVGFHILPTNLEVAAELDRLADENEGVNRLQRLAKMRMEALNLMKIVKKYNPVLIGSVWRGTIYRESDIDIIVYHNKTEEILKLLEGKFKILESGWTTVTKRGKPKKSFHIILQLQTNEKAEITIRNVEEIDVKERCEIYGDVVSGLTISELEKVLLENPTKRFVPF